MSSDSLSGVCGRGSGVRSLVATCHMLVWLRGLPLFGHADAMCPVFLQMKHLPSLRSLSRSSWDSEFRVFCMRDPRDCWLFRLGNRLR